LNGRFSGGIAAAALLGTAAGIALAPRANRREMGRRLRAGTRRLTHVLTHDRERIALAVGLSATKVADLTTLVFDRVREAVAAHSAPLARIRRALAKDARLRRRSISVDAIGDIILLQGAVEDDDEWQSADLLARHALPEGTIRNHLRVQRSTTAD
jgi:hypothetical protein